MKTPQQRADFVLAKHRDLFVTRRTEAQHLAHAGEPLEPTARRVFAIIDELAAKVAPQAACSKGCAHCCRISVVISSWEAERIGKHIHRAPAVMPVFTPGDAAAMRTRYTHQPCVFLKNNQCSIYDVRPAACRQHFSVESDPTLCDVKKHPGGRVQYFNFQWVDMVLAKLFMEARCTFGDIRDFFPAVDK